jgi:hypothetical protein
MLAEGLTMGDAALSALLADRVDFSFNPSG